MRRSTVVAACLIVPGVLGLGLTWFDRGDRNASDRVVATDGLTALEAESSDPVVRDSGDGSPTDVRSAAIAAVSMTDDVFRAGFISRRELIETFATDDFGSDLADKTSQQVTNLLLQLGERDVLPTDVSLVEQPVTAIVLKESRTAASVDVWSVLVVAADGAGPARQVWRTVSLDLELVDGRWLVAAWTSSLGPTPALAPEADLSGVDDVRVVADWPQVEKAGE